MRRVITILGALALALTSLTGCGAKEAYFTKGVYVNYAADALDPPKDYFYVFYDEGAGCTDDGNTGMGLPFSCTQKDGCVVFSFGGDDGIEDVLSITSVDGKIIRGHFDDGLELMFVPIPDADPATFDAVNYMNAAAGGDLIYHDANGWSVRYNPDLFTVNGGGPQVSFVYTGESAGTNMIMATYDVGKDAKTAIADLAKEWGNEATTDEVIFPGTDDVTGYRATLPWSNEGSGLYCSAVARDYMDGYLLFELTGHNSGNDQADKAVSDALSGLLDSLEFATYDE